MKLNAEFERELQKAIQQAHQEQYEIFSVEHLLGAVLQTARLKPLLHNLGVMPDKLLHELKDFTQQHIPKRKNADAKLPPVMSLGAQRMLQSAWQHSLSAGTQELRPEDLLVALYGEPESFALFLWRDKFGIARLKLLNEISHGSSGLGASHTKGETGSSEELGAVSAMERFCTHWSAADRETELPDFLQRDYLLKRLVQILSRQKRHHPLLVGDPGVGKTSLALNFAKRLLKGNVPKNLKALQFYELHTHKLMAGAKFRGELEERIELLSRELRAGEAKILFIDDIASLLATGNSGGQGLEISHLLRPLLESAKIHVIAACNHKEYKNALQKSNLQRFFQKLNIEECSKDEALAILAHKKTELENFHKLEIPPASLERAIDLAKRYLAERKLPDNAIDLLDEAGARLKLKEDHSKQLLPESLSEVVAEMTAIATENLQSQEGERLKHLQAKLKDKIFGQDLAVETLVKAIKFSFAGLAKENKPIGSYLFAGPSGVGKTELAIQLAQQLGLHFEKFDMSEYLEKHSVARLVGAPPGYVGYEEGGLLTDAISKHPYAVILMDEIEKAHPELINILLQIMDAGSLTDANGKNVDCRNIVLILTSNAGSKDFAKGSIGIGTRTGAAFDRAQLRNYFSPEFLNRLDAIVDFKPLSKEILQQVTQKFVADINQQLQKKAVQIQASEAAIAYLVDKAYDPVFGARPIHRQIDQDIKGPLVDEILYGRLRSGGQVWVELKDGQLDIRIEAAPGN